MIGLKKITKSFGSLKAVDKIDLEVKNGEIFGFLGPNGAGKTTTIKMITGILKQDEGQIHINDIDVVKEPIKAKMNIGFVPDSPNMFLRLKGIEYLNFMADLYEVPQKEREERIVKLSKKFSLEGALTDKIMSYSHGMRQKIVIMGALIHNPSIWILDEPMTGLDPKSSFELKEMMRKHADEGNSVFFSTHVLEVAEKVCDRVAIINKGQILFCGKLEEMKTRFSNDQSLENMFLEMTGNE